MQVKRLCYYMHKFDEFSYDERAVCFCIELAKLLLEQHRERLSIGIFLTLTTISLAVSKLRHKAALPTPLFLAICAFACVFATRITLCELVHPRMEWESDEFGLRFAANAGYNIKAVYQLNRTNKDPIFDSTTRAEHLKSFVEEWSRQEELGKIEGI